MIGTSTKKQADSASGAALVVYRPLVRLLVAALGALLTHQVAYLLSSFVDADRSSPVADHGHLAMQWALITPFAVVGGVGFAVWQLRALGFRSIVSTRTLSALVAGFFLMQEGIEATLSDFGATSLLANPAVLLGLFVAPVVAWAINKLLQGVTDFAAHLLQSPPFGPPGRPTRLVPVPVRWNSTNRASSSRPRAPPSRFRN